MTCTTTHEKLLVFVSSFSDPSSSDYGRGQNGHDRIAKTVKQWSSPWTLMLFSPHEYLCAVRSICVAFRLFLDSSGDILTCYRLVAGHLAKRLKT